jgi:hypothetical protein
MSTSSRHVRFSFYRPAAGYIFTAAQVSAAAAESLKHVLAGTTVGTNKYPHVLDNREGFTYPAGCTVTRYEFPVFKTSIYTGGDPSVDRVIIGHVSGSSAYSCGMFRSSELRVKFD